MSLYQCEKCGVKENSALGWYHLTEHKDPKYNNRKLCSACAPVYFSDGKGLTGLGEWHGRFKQVFYPVGTMETDSKGNLREKKK